MDRNFKFQVQESHFLKKKPPLGMYFDTVVVEVKTFLLLFRLVLAILWERPISRNLQTQQACILPLQSHHAKERMLNEEVGQFSAQLLKLLIMVIPLPLISSNRILTFRIWNSKEYIWTRTTDTQWRKFGRMWQTKYASAVLKNLGVEVDFRQCSEDQNDFMSGKKK